MDPPPGPSAAKLALGFGTAPLSVPLLQVAIEIGRALSRDGPAGFVTGIVSSAFSLAAGLRWRACATP